MKIKTIRIAGFRGVPPVTPPDVDIDLSSPSGVPKNLLLFGPNAYGKSSIADALEWFFKESVRGSTYFEEYSDSDNVHVKLGQPGFITDAYIEIVVEHNGTDYTLIKELNQSGKKIRENMDGIPVVIQQLENEIIVLDHDQFRKFVAAANTEKWTTFSSLIGYEELDYFRSGIESLSSRSLTDYLQKGKLEDEVNQKDRKWHSDLNQTISKYEVRGSKLDDLKAHFQTIHEVTLASLSLSIKYPDQDLSTEYWEELRHRVKAPDAIAQASSRLGELQTLYDKLTPLPENFANDILAFISEVRILAQKKNNFDKKVLSDFYLVGMRVLEEKKAAIDICPFCGTPFPWEKLFSHVESNHKALNFYEIEQQHLSLLAAWEKIKQPISDRKIIFAQIELSAVKDAYNLVVNIANAERSISLESFDAASAEQWAKNAQSLDLIIKESRNTVEYEKRDVEESLKTNPIAELHSKIEELAQLWNSIQILNSDLVTLQRLQRSLATVEDVIESLRTTTGRFRNELNDFSSRVVQIINDDVKTYYDELHPDDRIKPYLDVSVHGNQRVVSLRCDYRNILGRAAVTLLSESHRNSLGLAILLAFMKYKRQAGSPVGFCIFDDVTQSFDIDHRTNLLNLLENPIHPEISQQQIIFMTHDRTLADLIKRPLEQGVRENWVRLDIKNWWLEHMIIESDQASDPFQRAQYYIDQNDEIAAGIYTRRALEYVYKRIIKNARIKILMEDHPWRTSIDDYRKYILDEINELWQSGIGFINPNDPILINLFTSQRILNLTIHDSHFLEIPMTLGDVVQALAMVHQISDRFMCTNCKRCYHTLRKTAGANPHCKGTGCNSILS
jgi:recombinational DNA repair ATPase RecF